MDVCNISMYDWASSLGEAALMAVRIKKDRDTVIIPRSTHPDRKKVLRTYTKGIGLKIIEAAYDPTTGQLDLSDLEIKAGNKTAMIYLESPNFFGCIEEKAQKIAEIAKKVDAVFTLGTDPISLSVLRPPGDYGADIVIGDSQSLGNPIALGGSQVGVFACREEHIREMPGRLIGETTDLEGKQGFVLTLQPREQHIRRQKATSNICTNQALNALASAIYIAALGPGGLSRLGAMLISKPKKLAERINSIPGFNAPVFRSYHFREFVVRSEKNPQIINEALLKEGIQGGLILDRWYPELGNSTLYCVTEKNSEEEISMLIKALENIGGG
jgi:glycine dehydrogenase subunit 1